MRLAEGQSIVNFAKVTHEEQEDSQEQPTEQTAAPVTETPDNKE